jgi:uncharacterized protein with ParB-like and HNH nuclease domain
MYVQSKDICFDEFLGESLDCFTNLGVKQGNGISPELFTLFFDRVYPFILEYYSKRNVQDSKRCAYTIASM